MRRRKAVRRRRPAARVGDAVGVGAAGSALPPITATWRAPGSKQRGPSRSGMSAWFTVPGAV